VTGIADRRRVRNRIDQAGGLLGLRAKVGQVSGFLDRPLGGRDRQRDLVEDVGAPLVGGHDAAGLAQQAEEGPGDHCLSGAAPADLTAREIEVLLERRRRADHPHRAVAAAQRLIAHGVLAALAEQRRQLVDGLDRGLKVVDVQRQQCDVDDLDEAEPDVLAHGPLGGRS
jgi:hypothetical protein